MDEEKEVVANAGGHEAMVAASVLVLRTHGCGADHTAAR